ncbi:MAG: universal stress protein [Acidimicrobiales bacterium]
MFKRVIVPIDGSDESARALRPASAIARWLGKPMEVIAFHRPDASADDLQRLVTHQVAEAGDVQRTIEVRPAEVTVGESIAEVAGRAADGLIVMSTRGGGRSSALVGSVATEVLAATHAPVMLIGPKCDVGRIRLHGPMVVPVGMDESGAGLDLAAELAAEFGYRPVVANVVDPATSRELARARSGPGGGDMAPESAMAGRHAKQVEKALGSGEIDYEVLHDDKPDRAITALAKDVDATLITMTTAARSGLGRLRAGSVTGKVVAHSTCPVIAVAPT